MVAWSQLSIPVVADGEVAQIRNRTSARTANYRHFFAGLRFADLRGGPHRDWRLCVARTCGLPTCGRVMAAHVGGLPGPLRWS